MAYNQLTCTSALGKTGLACGSENLGYFQKLIPAISSFEISTQANSMLLATWQDAIDAEEIFPFKNFVMVENSNEDNVREELSTGAVVFVRQGKYRETGSVGMAVCEMIQHQKFNNRKLKTYLVTSNGYILGHSPDGVKFLPFDLDTLEVSNFGGTDGSTQRKVSVYYSLSTPSQIGEDVVAIKPTAFDPLGLEGLINVDVTVSGTSTSSLVTYTVTTTCDAEGVTGLVEGDFDFLVAAGTAQSGGTFAEVGSGVYKYTGSASFVTGTIDLKTPEDQTTGGYYSTGEASFTI